MNKRKKFCVYLAGPISGCNPAQRSVWRDEIKRKYSSYFDFFDPTSTTELRGAGASPWEIVNADLNAIENADGMIVNMWRESIGSAISMVHAQRSGLPVVIADPNRLGNAMASFYADAITHHPLIAAKTLLAILRGQDNWEVIKSNPDVVEPFERSKLVNALRGVCRDAQLDDVAVPRLALPGIIDKLKSSRRKVRNQISSRNIDQAVVATFEELEKDPAHRSQARMAAYFWKKRRDSDLDDIYNQVKEPEPNFLDKEHSKVRIFSGSKPHATIWGSSVNNLDQIPSRKARQVLRIIANVPGVTGVTFGSFGHKGSRATTGASLEHSSITSVLSGKLFDHAPKGTMQSFQVEVQFDEEKPQILKNIIDLLSRENLWHD